MCTIPKSMATPITHAPLYKVESLRRVRFYQAFAAIYICAISALLYQDVLKLFKPDTLLSLAISLSLLVADILLAFMWLTTTSFRMRPIRRHECLENLEQVLAKPSDVPPLDVFICTADPYKEPPINVVNTALSVMAYDYPTEKISVYVSDDGGSELTMFGFTEAANFARYWLPFCREKNILERCPGVYFGSLDLDRFHLCSETTKIKAMYEDMKARVEKVMDTGKVTDEYKNGEIEREVFNQWSSTFTRQDHPTVIQVLLESGKDRDVEGDSMPNLIYVSRQKSVGSTHHFKAGALNVLLRVSAVMTNAPILTLDCDMYSNDPKTPKRALCYFSEPAIRSNLGYVQFPQRYHGINEHDTYACEHKRLFKVNLIGMDGLSGPNYVGTGCFFTRRVFFGGPSSIVLDDIVELGPFNEVNKPIKSKEILSLAHHIADCHFEDGTFWGEKMGFRYGSLVEDYFTGYRLQCEGWRSIFCNPQRPAFLGDIPINLADVLNQNKRWGIGLLEVAFSKHCPLIFGTRSMGLLMGLCYAHIAFWTIWSIPIVTYAILPQLALLRGVSVFPKVSDPQFLLYAFLFVGSYTQDFVDFYLSDGTFQQWWSDQRMWMIRGVSSYIFAILEFSLKSFGVNSFNITSKVLDEEQSKKYEQGVFEFGVESPMFVTLGMVSLINFAAFLHGVIDIFVLGRRGCFDRFFIQMFIASFAVINCLPVYEAMFLRSDKGRMPLKTTLISISFALGLFITWVLLYPGHPDYSYQELLEIIPCDKCGVYAEK